MKKIKIFLYERQINQTYHEPVESETDFFKSYQKLKCVKIQAQRKKWEWIQTSHIS